ncbi:Uncharacterised protein [Mycobacteroides abscessus subsp. abscessus]|nr:Uncharacterised protein [Mycobacteroides abscessus subsp. abscessus]
MYVGPRNCCRSNNIRMRQHRLLNRSRVDVVASADDQVLGPSCHIHEPVRIQPAEISGQEPAVLDHTSWIRCRAIGSRP